VVIAGESDEILRVAPLSAVFITGFPAMPMPREEDDDLFHREADVDFDDADEKPKKKTAKKKVAKKKAAAPKKAAPAPAPKKTTKKKVKRAPAKEIEELEEEEAPAPRKTAKKKPAKVVIDKPVPIKKKAPAKPSKPAKTTSFGAGLFDEVEEEREPVLQDPPAKDEAPAVDFQREYTEADEPVERTGAAAIDAKAGDDKVDEYGRPAPLANYVVHVYELGRLKRTIDRDFTPEAAEAFATEFSRTSKRYGRSAVAGKKDTQPAKELV
jgi:hypothetical protein